jgi:5'-nucleotidase
MKRLPVFLIALLFVTETPQLAAAETALTIIHSNDMHSHFLGAPPNIDYTPLVTGDDETIGGWARIATVIKQVRRNRDNPVLVVDAGDFLMGSLFHLLSRQRAFELQLLYMMGYDAVALGNHEFDLKPEGLARILTSARNSGKIPPLVLANAVFSSEDPGDDALEKVFASGVVRPYRVLEKGSIRIGIFALMGKDAAEVAPFASPVTFADPIETARKMVKVLRDSEHVDLVICLSHSGLDPDPKHSEDEILAREVSGIDVIISGHTHTKLDRALLVNGTVIVQAWEYGKQLGIMDIVLNDGQVTLKDYRLVDINDAIAGDAEMSHAISSFEAAVNQQVLADDDLAFRQAVAETGFDLTIDTSESNLGNLIADAMRWYANQNDYDPADPATRVVAAVISNGVIRDPIVAGKTGRVAVCDAFRAIPLGIGFDEMQTMGYPLITFYVYPSEMKKTLEILTSIYPLKGSDYFLQISGVKFVYNPHRMIFDRVTDIWLGDEQTGYQPLDYSASNHSLLRVTADIYNATFLKIIGGFTWNMLNIVPKDRNGNPVDDLATRRLDADKTLPGIQELKEWKAVIAYLQSFADTDSDGLPEVPGRYRGPLGRQKIVASWNPYRLLKNGTKITWLAFGALLLAVVFVVGVSWFTVKKIRGRSK